MKISEYGALLEKALPAKRRVLGIGKPGIGKTFEVMAVCRRLHWDYIGLSCPTLSPVKVGGYPRPPQNPGEDATHALFDGIAQAFRATVPTVLFWDDLGMASGETLKAIVQLVQFGQIDQRKLPDCVVQLGASNDVGHGADVQGLIEPLKTRWHTIVPIEPSLDDLVRYGLAKGWPADLLAYLRNSPDAMHDWKPCKDMKIDGACPRGWEYVAEWINLGVDDPEVIAGCVGKGRAAEYLAFRGLINELPDVDAVLVDPEGSPVPDNPSAQWLVTMALAGKLNGGTFGQAVKYLGRLKQMFRAFGIRDAVKAENMRVKDGTLPKGYARIHASRDFTAWANSDDGQAILSAAKD